MIRPDQLSERIIFGLIIFGGYYGIGAAMVFMQPKNPDVIQLTRDTMLTVGPLLGMIVKGIWEDSRVATRQAETAKTLADKAPNLSGVDLGQINANPTQSDSMASGSTDETVVRAGTSTTT